ncbi:MAG TPA: nicotinate-nucleotide--dimethylbenzimidazole phosphoribosyltransferase [Desulfitobacteriaceae bacterium]|nr:nicotinate-nucleotide--dimethylbenzimidazole phosphoribosyltransferase [Desulfitobacteriaceae bacterium]
MSAKSKTYSELQTEFQQLLGGISTLDEGVMTLIQEHLDSLTKPQGSLGQLEVIVKQIGGIQGTAVPKINKKAVLLMAGDHGVVAEGVSAFPQEVTPQMVYNFLNGGAAINVLTRQAGADVICTDVGVAFPLEPAELMSRRVANGTNNMAKGPAMTPEEALQALLVGAEVARETIDGGVNLLATGDMGIGNTTPSSAIVAFYTELPISKVVGRGTGIDDAGLILKQTVIKQALEVNNPDRGNALDVLAKVGGLEIAAIAGSILQAAAKRVPIIIDGFISTAGAIIAAQLCPLSKAYMIPSHGSVEIGHRAALEYLGLEPMLNLNMRLGEGTGAALSFYLVEAGIHILEEMSTFADAGVSEKNE